MQLWTLKRTISDFVALLGIEGKLYLLDKTEMAD